MRKVFLLILALMVMSLNLQAQSCDCTIVPFKPKSCFRVCAPMVIQAASESELKLIVGLPSDLASKVYQLKPVLDNDLDNLSESLTEVEYTELVYKLNNLSEAQAEYFGKNIQERRKINRQFQKLEVN